MISIGAESLALAPDELAALVQLEQREQRDGLRHAVGIAAHRLVEGEACRDVASRSRTTREPPLERHRDPGHVARVHRRRRAQQPAHRVGEPLGLVCLAAPPRTRPGAAPAAAARRGSGTAAPASKRSCIHSDAALNLLVLEQAREQLLGGLARLEVEPSSSSEGSISRDFSSSSAAIRIRNSVAASRSSSPRASSRSM